MTALYVIAFVALVYVMLRGIRDWRHDRRAERQRTSWLSQHERTVRYQQTQREADESRPITWRR